jgi:hypothetical protein
MARNGLGRLEDASRVTGFDVFNNRRGRGKGNPFSQQGMGRGYGDTAVGNRLKERQIELAERGQGMADRLARDRLAVESGSAPQGGRRDDSRRGVQFRPEHLSSRARQRLSKSQISSQVKDEALRSLRQRQLENPRTIDARRQRSVGRANRSRENQARQQRNVNRVMNEVRSNPQFGRQYGLTQIDIQQAMQGTISPAFMRAIQGTSQGTISATLEGPAGGLTRIENVPAAPQQRTQEQQIQYAEGVAASARRQAAVGADPAAGIPIQQGLRAAGQTVADVLNQPSVGRPGPVGRGVVEGIGPQAQVALGGLGRQSPVLRGPTGEAVFVQAGAQPGFDELQALQQRLRAQQTGAPQPLAATQPLVATPATGEWGSGRLGVIEREAAAAELQALQQRLADLDSLPPVPGGIPQAGTPGALTPFGVIPTQQPGTALPGRTVPQDRGPATPLTVGLTEEQISENIAAHHQRSPFAQLANLGLREAFQPGAGRQAGGERGQGLTPAQQAINRQVALAEWGAARQADFDRLNLSQEQLAAAALPPPLTTNEDIGNAVNELKANILPLLDSSRGLLNLPLFQLSNRIGVEEGKLKEIIEAMDLPGRFLRFSTSGPQAKQIAKDAVVDTITAQIVKLHRNRPPSERITDIGTPFGAFGTRLDVSATRAMVSKIVNEQLPIAAAPVGQ